LAGKAWKTSENEAGRFQEKRHLYRGMFILLIEVESVSTLTAILHREEDIYIAECPEAGTVSQGASIDEALKNLKEATELYLEEFPLKNGGKVLMTTFEVSVGASP